MFPIILCSQSWLNLLYAECKLPSFFAGIRKLHDETNFHMHSEHSHTDKLTKEAAEIMSERLKNEIELYNFVKSRLFKQYEECFTNNK